MWRVIERSDLVVQIVDARNPLLFRSEDLENYVKEVDKQKRNLLLVNKADMMTFEQRKAWAEYFVDKSINFRFFSAELARELNEAREDGGNKKSNPFDDLYTDVSTYTQEGFVMLIGDMNARVAQAQMQTVDFMTPPRLEQKNDMLDPTWERCSKDHIMNPQGTALISMMTSLQLLAINGTQIQRRGNC